MGRRQQSPLHPQTFLSALYQQPKTLKRQQGEEVFENVRNKGLINLYFSTNSLFLPYML